MIYFGRIFMDYIQYNYIARDIARAAAFHQDVTDTGRFLEGYSLMDFYMPEIPTPDIKDKTVTVTINLTLDENKKLWLFKFLKFPPDKLTLKYTMPFEKEIGS